MHACHGPRLTGARPFLIWQVLGALCGGALAARMDAWVGTDESTWVGVDHGRGRGEEGERGRTGGKQRRGKKAVARAETRGWLPSLASELARPPCVGTLTCNGVFQGHTVCTPTHRAPSPRCTAEPMHHVWHRSLLSARSLRQPRRAATRRLGCGITAA